MHKLTLRQSEVLGFLKQYVEENSYPPTRAEIAQALGFKSVNAAEEHLKALSRKGVIQMIPGASRGIRIPAFEQEQGLPIIGRVAAGFPILAQQHIEEYSCIKPDFFHPTADFLLKVTGHSMKNAGILDGDLLAVKTAQEARSGQIVIARLNNEVTVKKLKLEQGAIWLLAENPEYSHIKINPETHEFYIEGISVGLIRKHF